MPTNNDFANTTSSSSANSISSRNCFRMKYGKAFFEVDLAALPEHIDHAKQLIGLVIDKMKRRSRAILSHFPNATDPTANSLRLSRAIDEYLKNLADRKKSKSTLKAYRSSLEILLAVAGDVPVASVDHMVIGEFYKNLRWWPQKAGSFKHLRNLSPREVLEFGLTQAKPQKIAPATEIRHTAGLNAFFETMLSIGQVPRNPMTLAKRDRAGQARLVVKSRHPFEQSDLHQIFNPSTFVPWASKYPHTWWIPQIALFTGARVEEIAQLRADDIQMDNGAMCFFLRPTSELEVEVDGMRERTFKNIASMRVIPIAQPLLDAGLLTFIDEVKAAGLVRLFPQLKAGIDSVTGELNGTGYSNRHIRQFGEYLRSNTDIKKGVSTHCFRHLITTALDRSQVSDGVIASITGHAPAKSKFVHLQGYKQQEPGHTLRPKQVAALATFDPGVALPPYTPGQFEHWLGASAKRYP